MEGRERGRPELKKIQKEEKNPKTLILIQIKTNFVMDGIQIKVLLQATYSRHSVHLTLSQNCAIFLKMIDFKGCKI